MNADQGASPLHRYIAIGRRRLGILVGVTVLVPAVALGFSLAQDERYEATSLVLLSRQNLANSLSGITEPGAQQQSFAQILTTQAALARVPAVVRIALAQAGDDGRSVQGFLDDSAVVASDESDLLRFSATAGDPRAAMRISSAYATAFVAYRQRLDTASLDAALRELRRTAAASPGGSADGGSLPARLASKEQELETLRALQTSNARVVSTPQDATRVQPRPVRNAVIGLIFGMLLAVGLALLRDLLDTRVRSADEIGSTLRLPLLTRVGKPEVGPDGFARLVMMDDPGNAHAECFRILRTNLKFMNLDRKAKVIMVSSAVQGEGKSTTIANLALAAARGGESVALVDLDLRRPSLDKIFRVPAGVGLTSVAMGNTSLNAALVDVAPSLSLLTSGPPPPDPGEFVTTQALAAVLEELRTRFDLVLVDAPPLVGVSDTMVLTDVVDAMFLCARVGLLRRPRVYDLRQVLDVVRVPVLGYVVTGAEADANHGYGYGYGYAPAVEAAEAPDAATVASIHPGTPDERPSGHSARL